MRIAFFLGALTLALGYAFWRGGGPERSVAALLLLATITTGLVQPALPLRFHDVEVGVLLVDGALFLTLLGVALHADRYWPLWMTALQGIAIAGHGAKAVNPFVIPFAYAVLLNFWGYPMIALLALGTWRHRVRLKRFGRDRSWTRSWPRWRPRGIAAGRSA